MKKLLLTVFCFVLLTATYTSKAYAETLTKQEIEELTWAKRICLSSEYGFSSNHVIRWNHPVKVSVIQGEINLDVIEVVNTLNDLLKESTVNVEIEPYPNKEADIEIYLTDYKHFPKIAKDNKFYYADGNWGYFYGFWNKQYELKKAYILIATDKLQGARLKHFIFEEIVQSFGLMNDSRTYTDSIFFSGNEYDEIHNSLSIRDKKLVRFLYSKMNSGDSKKQFEEAFKKHWKEL